MSREMAWPDLSYCEDHRLYEAVRASAQFSSRITEADDLVYVQRRHATNVSAPHRKDMWQGIIPLQLAPGSVQAAMRVGELLVRHGDTIWLMEAPPPRSSALMRLSRWGLPISSL